MAVYQARAIIPYKSGIPQDVVVNTLCFRLDDPPGVAAVSLLTDFYNEPVDETDTSIADLLHVYLDRTGNACRFEFYEVNLATGDVGSPLAVVPWTLLGDPDENNLPLEVAVCTSFAAAPSEGSSPGTRKGRIFIGPFNQTVCTAGDDDPTRPDVNAILTLSGATQRLVQDTEAGGIQMVVWSRKDNAAYEIVRGWVDNAFDTQRRRGVDPSSRTVWNKVIV